MSKASTSLLIGQDKAVADWAFQTLNSVPIQYNMAVGVIDKEKKFVGAFMFTGYNTSDVEVHIYGPGVFKKHVLREIFVFAVKILKCNRMTVRTRKSSMSRGVLKLGALYEGTMRRIYGPTDDDIHKAEQFVFFRERMEQLIDELSGSRKDWKNAHVR